MAAAFATVAGRPVDPVVRGSDRADAQANGALALAKEMGRPPRELAQAVIDAADLDGICRDVELAGPGFINLTFDEGYLGPHRRRGGHGPSDWGSPAPTTPSASSSTTRIPTSPRRCTSGTCARRSSATPWPACSPVPATPSSGRTTSATGAPRSACSSSTWSTSGRPRPRSELSVGDLDGFYKQARTKFDADAAFAERARQRVVALQGGDPATLRLWTRLVEESTRYFDAVYGRLGVLLQRRGPAGRERLQRSASRGRPTPGRGRGCWSSRRRARCVFPPGFTNRDGAAAAADRAQGRRRLRLRDHGPGHRDRPQSSG